MEKSSPQTDKTGRQSKAIEKAVENTVTWNNKNDGQAGKFDGLTEKLRHSSDPESDVAGHDLRNVDPRETDFDPTIQYTDGRD